MTENTTGNRSEQSTASAVRSVPGRVLSWLAGLNTFALMLGFFLAGFLADRTASLAQFSWLFFLLGGVLPLVLATVSTEEDGYEHELSNRVRAKILFSQLVWAFTPWGILTQLLQLVGTISAYVRYRGRLPSRDRHVPETELAVPFEGEWTAVNGGVTKRSSHSWGIVSQRYAYDFVVTDDDGDSHEGSGETLSEYHAFGKPIRAPADGTVRKTESSLRDHPHPGSGWLEYRTWQIAGNYVVIEHETGEYSLLAHLQQGSVTVEPGDEVQRGEIVGRCGSSGMSTEPHLHFQLQDRPSFWFAAGLVPRFVDTAVARSDDRREDHVVYEAAQEPGNSQYLWAGDRVRSTDGSDRTPG